MDRRVAEFITRSYLWSARFGGFTDTLRQMKATVFSAIAIAALLFLGACSQLNDRSVQIEPSALAGIQLNENGGLSARDGYDFVRESSTSYALLERDDGAKKGTFTCKGGCQNCAPIDISHIPGKPILMCGNCGNNSSCRGTFKPEKNLLDTNSDDLDHGLFEGLSVSQGEFKADEDHEWVRDPSSRGTATLRKKNGASGTSITISCECALIDDSAGGCNLIGNNDVVVCADGACGVLCLTELSWGSNLTVAFERECGGSKLSSEVGLKLTNTFPMESPNPE